MFLLQDERHLPVDVTGHTNGRVSADGAVSQRPLDAADPAGFRVVIRSRNTAQLGHPIKHLRALGRIHGQGSGHDAHSKAGNIAHEQVPIAVKDDPTRCGDGHQARSVLRGRGLVLISGDDLQIPQAQRDDSQNQGQPRLDYQIPRTNMPRHHAPQSAELGANPPENLRASQ